MLRTGTGFITDEQMCRLSKMRRQQICRRLVCENIAVEQKRCGGVLGHPLPLMKDVQPLELEADTDLTLALRKIL